MAIQEHLSLWPPGVPEYVIVIGFSATRPQDYGLSEEKMVVISDRFLPRALVAAGVYPTTSKVKRERPDLWVTFPDDHSRVYQIPNKSKGQVVAIVHVHVGFATRHARNVSAQGYRPAAGYIEPEEA